MNPITILGLGYVGLPLALNLAKAGFSVKGFDPDKRKIELLNSFKSYINDIPDSEIEIVTKNYNFSVDYNLIESETYIICVPTPLTNFGTSDVSMIKEAAMLISKVLKVGDLVILESSTYPGTTEEILIPILETKGLIAGKDFSVGYAPERVNPGSKTSYKDVNRIVSGLTNNCLEKVYTIYASICNVVYKCNSIKTAEVSKLLENSYRLVNISLINSLTKYCEKIQVSVNDVIEAAKTKPFGFVPFTPSLGAGGHCIPIDPIYLSEKMEELDLDTSLIRSAQKINNEMHIWVRNKISELLNPISKTKKILLHGVTYKKNVNDVRHSYAIDLFRKLIPNFIVEFHDPLVKNLSIDNKNIEGVVIDQFSLDKYDLIVLNHSAEKELFSKISNKNLIILDLQSPPLNLKNVKYFKL